jgi:hypothetical protein
MALTTRPSQPRDGRTAARTDDTTRGSRAARLRAGKRHSKALLRKPYHRRGSAWPARHLFSITTRADRHGGMGPATRHQPAHADHPAVGSRRRVPDLLDQRLRTHPECGVVVAAALVAALSGILTIRALGLSPSCVRAANGGRSGVGASNR